MNELHGNLNQLSDESLKHLLNYFAEGILTLQGHRSIQKDLTRHRATSRDVSLQG